ncbi:MAG: hypothetical protein WAW73_05970 [Rhodoferax sp.]|jgi:hypothetical protein
MSKLNWHAVPQGELALLLKQATLDDSRAVGASTVYRLNLAGREVLAVSLADGSAVIIEAQVPSRAKRRRVDPPVS